MPKTILVIEDEKPIQSVLKAFLVDAGYTVLLAGDGVEGLEKFHQHLPDLVLLDILLPGIDGFAVCKTLRQESRVPIIMLTALDDDASQIKGFDAMADDYITKPFSMPLVLRRIEAVLRRSEQGMQSETAMIRYKDLTMDTDSFTVHIGQELVPLTTREFEILKFLLENRGMVFSSAQIYENVWNEPSYGADNIVAVHIRHIREKIEINPKEPRYLKVIWGHGYKMEKL